MMKRGDEVTRVEESIGMELRARPFKNGGGHIPCTGARWVHKFCTPIHTYPDGRQVPVWTSYAAANYNPFEDPHTYE